MSLSKSTLGPHSSLLAVSSSVAKFGRGEVPGEVVASIEQRDSGKEDEWVRYNHERVRDRDGPEISSSAGSREAEDGMLGDDGTSRPLEGVRLTAV